MKRNKAILSIILIVVILLIAGASIYISSKVSQEQAIAPTAPVSEPAACEDECPRSDGALVNCTGAADGTNISTCNEAGRVELCGGKSYTCPAPGGAWALTPTSTEPDWVGSAACTVTATSVCVASETITCSPDCPTECGKPASTISSCKDSCGVATTKTCAATVACTENLVVNKKAYKYTGGTYAYTTEIDTVAKNQTFLYAISIENKGEVDVSGVSITDTLNGEHQDQLTFVDTKSGCTYSATEKRVNCDGITVKAGETGVYAFKVKVGGDAVNGDIIKNGAVVRAANTDISASNELTISTVLGCNHTCTGDSECSTGLVCDTGLGKCRLATNLESDTCSAPMVARPTTIRTPAPTRVVGEITEAPLPTERPVVITQPTVLPETGILDFPGVAAFGGGLLLAIVGILLAL